MVSAIYLIQNGDKYYIGSTGHLVQRWWHHRYTLSKGNHPNKYLQRAYNKCPDGFSYFVLEYCPRESLIEREQLWLDFFEPPYNLSRVAGSPQGYRHTPEAKEKIGAVTRGIPKTAEHRARLSASVRATYKQKKELIANG